jgi:hypothetical protein
MENVIKSFSTERQKLKDLFIPSQLSVSLLCVMLGKLGQESRWQIANRPWKLDLHNFEQLLQIFVTARI